MRIFLQLLLRVVVCCWTRMVVEYECYYYVFSIWFWGHGKFGQSFVLRYKGLGVLV